MWSPVEYPVKGTVLALLLVGLGGCIGDGGGGGGAVGGDTTPTGGTTTPTHSATLAELMSGAVSLAEGSPSAPFDALPSGVSPVTVNSPPVVNFVVETPDGTPISGLTTNEVALAFAKLVPGSDGNADHWVSYITRTKSGTAVPDGAVQATTESNGTLTYHEEDGYYSYAFATDVTSVTLPGSSTLIWDPSATHRVAIQLRIRDANRATVAVANPYYDFTIDANGDSVPLVDDSRSHIVVDRSACNQCHNQLSMHGGSRIDPQFCVLCHNPGTQDAVTGNVIDFKVMIHKIHRGTALTQPYAIGTYSGTAQDFTEVAYPQDLRNCTKCHDGTLADTNGHLITPQGDNWKLRPTQEACGACHDDVDFNDHRGFDFIAADGTPDNSECVICHVTGGSNVYNPHAVENVHWSQAEAHVADYQASIEAVTLNADRTVTIDYVITNPADGSAYDILDSRFSSVRVYVASNNTQGVVGDDYSGTVNVYANGLTNGTGAPSATNPVTDLGGHHYRVTTAALSADAHGTARVAIIGQVKELLLDVATRLPVDGTTTVNVPMRNALYDLDLSTGLAGTPRREVVATEKCDSCHGTLGVTFHSGARNSTEVCAMCHDANRLSAPTMADGTPIKESYQFKRMIHGIHSGEMRENHFLHGNMSNGTGNDFTAEVHYPGILNDCTTCHVNDSYRSDRGAFATSVAYGPDNSRGTADDERMSPKAATCASCHDQASLRIHLTDMGAALDQTQAVISSAVYERCDECHGNGGPKDVKVVHGIR